MRKILVMMVAAVFLAACSSAEQRAVDEAVRKQMRTYPESTLQDIYKNFYHDVFGPGHVIVNVDSAVESLLEEAGETTEEPYGGILYDYTGAEGNFVRVNLYVLNSRTVTEDDFVSAFLRSVKVNGSADHEKFRNVWSMAAKAAAKYHLPGYEEDLESLNGLVYSGSEDKAVHHSDAYREAYNPHYRLIARDIFERELKGRMSLNQR